MAGTEAEVAESTGSDMNEPTNDSAVKPGKTPSSSHQEQHLQDASDPTVNETAGAGGGGQSGPIVHINNHTERKQQQKVGFDDWFANKAARTDVSKVKVSRKSDKEELQSLKDMLHAEQKGHMIIGSERAYQIELFEKAKMNNTIAVLDTGSGKTLIAVLLLKHMLENEVEDRAAGKPRKLAFFLVDKVALMLQQHAVLTANLRFKIERLSGETGARLGDVDFWQDLYRSSDVVVCTADVLLHALMRSYVQMEAINLLIFDEVHHAKKGHAYARICNEFYKKNPTNGPRPRIFGMTASPIDTEESDEQAILELILELEKTTQSHIATIPNSGQLRGFVHRPDEESIFYRRPPRFDSYLFQALHSKYWDLEHFKSLFITAKTIKSELGPWCSDMFWSFAFSEKEAKKVELRAEREGKRYRRLANDVMQEMTSAEIEQLRQAAVDIKDHQFKTPRAIYDDLSEKVLELHACLSRHFERPSDSRCLIFVNERVTARLLNLVFEHIGTPHLKTGILLGSTSNNFEESKFTFKSQFVTLMKFKSGELNCLFATTVAEEGLDVPDCNLVIRFDYCRTMIQYVQSRGRARHQNSKMYHFFERGNTDDEDRHEMILESETEMRKCFENLPKDRLLQGDMSEEEEEEFDENAKLPVFIIPSTGARLTYHFSLLVLSNYVDSLPRDEGEESLMMPQYYYFRDGEKFQCEVSMPHRTGLSSITGRAYRKKKIAKMSAAFETCKFLKKQKLLDSNLLPTRVKQLHVMRQARLAVTSKRPSQYPCQRKPALWAEGRATIPDSLYLTVLSLPDGWDRPVRTLGLLTRTRLPDFPSFPLFQRNGKRSDLHPVSSSDSIPVTSEQVSQLTWFLLTIWKDLYNKTYEENDAQMSYWLAPLKTKHSNQGPLAGVYHDIDWDMLSSIHRLEADEWTPDHEPSSLVGRFFVDPFDGGRRLYSLGLRPDMQMNDTIPDNLAPGPKGAGTIIDYSCSLWRKSKGRRTWNQGQPVLEADKILHRLNILSEPSEADKFAKTRCFVCPEPLNISRLSADVAAMGYLYPGIVLRIESYLIALEFAQVLNLKISPALALEAVTKDSDNSDDAEAEKINFQRGMGPNYERLEFIGDCFLKMATSIATFIRHAGRDEYWMHVERMLLLCNANLCELSKEKGYPKYIRSLQLSRRTWYPEAIKLQKGKGADKTDAEMSPSQDLGNKTIADVCEAMIGAALISNVDTGRARMSCWDDAVRAVTKFVWTEKYSSHDMDCWADYYKAYELPNYQTSHSTAAELDAARQVEKSHPYRFRYPKLLQSAFTHTSVPRAWSTVPNYQRLEFLGDSLLDMTADMYLFTKYPTKDPQWLTEHKEAMVSNKFLGTLAAHLGFNKHLNHSHSAIEGQISTFMQEFRTAQADANGAVDFWTGLRDPPKCLADMVEAYVGALFIDTNFIFPPIQDFFDMHILPFFTDMTPYDTFANSHPINRLRDILESHLGCSSWGIHSRQNLSDDEMSSVVFAAVVVHGRVVGEGSVAKTGRVAKAYAAKDAAAVLEGEAPFEFRKVWGCDCDGKGGEADADLRGTAI